MQAYNIGVITRKQARDILVKLGVDFDPILGIYSDSVHKVAWDALFHQMTRFPNTETVLQGFNMGLLKEAEARQLIKRSGAVPENWDWVKNLLYPVPDPTLILQAFAREQITPEEFSDGMHRAGTRIALWSDYVKAFYGAPTVGEVLTLRNRGEIDDGEFDALLRRNSLGFARDRELITKLRRTYPSISDLILMQVREAFDPVLANRLRLYDEAPKDIVKYFEAQGLNWEVGINGNVDGINRPLRWPDMYWASHWKTISSEQSYRMFHLLRPNRIARFQEVYPGTQPFTRDDLFFWLRINDYPISVRNQLAAINIQPLRLIDIRTALRFKIRDADWAYEQFLDRGHLPDDARTQVEIVQETERQRLLAGARNLERNALSLTIRDALKGYKTGTIGRQAVTDLLKANTVDDKSIELTLNSIDFEVKNETAASAIKLVRRRFFDGIIGVDGAVDELKRIGIVDNRVDNYVARWRLERDQRYRLVTTAKIQRWAKLGLLTYDDAKLRLTNLGWSNTDALLYLSETQTEINQLTLRNLQASQRTQRQQAKELQAIAERADALLRRTQADLRRISPISTLQKWLKQGVIGEPFFVARARSMGYPDADIRRYLESASANGQAQSPSGGPTTGQTGQAP
jgi:hypothetical protein